MINNILKFKENSPVEILQKLEVKEAPFDPFEIAEKLGVKVIEELDWDRMGNDGEIWVENNKPIIWINPTVSENRKNFTLAHELGHLIFDVWPNIDKFTKTISDDYTTLKRNSTSNPMEIRANKFAAQLLMPQFALYTESKILIDKYQEEEEKKIPLSILIRTLSNKFEVSEDAMEIRLKSVMKL